MAKRQLDSPTRVAGWEPAVPAEWDATQSRILDAADALIMQRGVHGLTVAELARQAGLSRPTIYRNWADAGDVVRAVLQRRVIGILSQFASPAATRTELVDDVLRFSRLFQDDPVYGQLLTQEPEVFTRYTLQRFGSSQRTILQWLAAAIDRCQADGSVRAGSSAEISVMLLLIAQSALLSHGTVRDLIDDDAWNRELRAALEGHLRP